MQYLTTFIFCLVVLYGEHCVEGDFCFLDNDGTMPVEYDPASHLCCGQIIPLNGIEKSCCAGVTPYNLVSEFCCGNEIYPKMTTNGRNQGCCGGRPFVQDGKSFCCGDKLYNSTDDGEGCCGSFKVNKDEDCCYDYYRNTSVHRRLDNHACCGIVYYDLHTKVCVAENQIMEKGYSMCGANKFNSVNQSCCHGKVYNEPRRSHDDCCGTVKYNSENEICCGLEHVIPKGGICCGSGYASGSQLCCGGAVLDTTSSSQDCCGTNLYNPNNGEGCCMPKAQIYVKSSRKCCKSGIVVEKDQGCCGTHSLNTNTSVCCNDSYVITKQREHHDRCCSSKNQTDGKSYNSIEQRCTTIRGTRMYFVEDRGPMCDSKPYNREVDLCCNNELYSNGITLGLQCCYPGKSVYDLSTEVCCNSIVYDKSDNERCGHNNGQVLSNEAVSRNGKYTPGKEKDTENENREYLGICRICHLDPYQALQDLKDGEIDVCYNNANKFRIKTERPSRGYQLLGKTTRNYFNGETRVQYVHIPCSCRIDLKNILIITDKSARKRKLLLDRHDIVLPYSIEIRNRIRRIHKSECRSKTDVKELLNDLKVYLLQLQLKVDKLEKKVIRNS